MENITASKKSDWYDKNYKKLMVIPVALVFFALIYLIVFYIQNGDIMYKDTSLTGGTIITLSADFDLALLVENLNSEFPDLTTRQLTELSTGKTISYILESSASPDSLKSAIEKFLGKELTDENSSIEFTGPSLSQSFYKQLMIALFISFICMSFVVFFLFRTFVPSMAIIFAALGNIILSLSLSNILGIKLSAAGIAAFLMLIGYSVDTDVLLTTRALKRKNHPLNQRLWESFKTGSFMTTTSLVAVLSSFLFMSGLPDSFRQIFMILAMGLSFDLMNTWLTNASIIKWYCEVNNIK